MKVLITGTTTGIGRALKELYLSQGHQVIGINRTVCEDEPLYRAITLDIANYDQVRDFLFLLDEKPDLFILNAGINLPDNVGGFDFSTYRQVMRTNLDGVLTFAGAISEIGIRGARIACISSTSNTVPNPGHLGYYLSKLGLKEAFRALQQNDPQNSYATLILGPVHTEIAADYSGPQGFQAKVFDWLAMDCETTAKHAAKFFASQKSEITYPRKAALFYSAVKALLLFFPWLYRGTESPKTSFTQIANTINKTKNEI